MKYFIIIETSDFITIGSSTYFRVVGFRSGSSKSESEIEIDEPTYNEWLQNDSFFRYVNDKATSFSSSIEDTTGKEEGEIENKRIEIINELKDLQLQLNVANYLGESRVEINARRTELRNLYNSL